MIGISQIIGRHDALFCVVILKKIKTPTCATDTQDCLTMLRRSHVKFVRQAPRNVVVVQEGGFLFRFVEHSCVNNAQLGAERRLQIYSASDKGAKFWGARRTARIRGLLCQIGAGKQGTG